MLLIAPAPAAVTLVLSCLFLRMKNHNKKAKKAIKAMPPITPPTMAPMGVDFFFEEGPGEGGEVGVVLLPPADGVEGVDVAEGVTVTVFTVGVREELPPSRMTWEEVGRRVAMKA